MWQFGPWGLDPNRIPRNSELGFSPAGIYVTELSALQLTTVMACVALKADAVADLPINVFRRNKGIREPIDPPTLVTDPFVDADPDDGIFQAIYSLEMRGNWYSLVAGRDSLGRVTALKAPTHPDTVNVTQQGGKIVYRVAGKFVDPVDIIHVKAFSIPGRPTGYGPIDYARTTFGLGLAQQEYASRFFSQGAQANTVITFPDDKSQEEVDEALDIWRSHHQGLYNAHQPGVLTNGGKIESVSVTPEQAQFLESRRFQVTEVARLFRVPPWMVADVDKSTSWGTGIESQGIHFASYTLRADIRRVERVFTKLLPRPQYARMDISSIVRADLLTRLEAYERGRNAGLWSIDEIRALEDLPPLPDGKGSDHLEPLNYAPVGAGSAPMPSKPAPSQGGPNDGE